MGQCQGYCHRSEEQDQELQCIKEIDPRSDDTQTSSKHNILQICFEQQGNSLLLSENKYYKEDQMTTSNNI